MDASTKAEVEGRYAYYADARLEHSIGWIECDRASENGELEGKPAG